MNKIFYSNSLRLIDNNIGILFNKIKDITPFFEVQDIPINRNSISFEYEKLIYGDSIEKFQFVRCNNWLINEYESVDYELI